MMCFQWIPTFLIGIFIWFTAPDGRGQNVSAPAVGPHVFELFRRFDFPVRLKHRQGVGSSYFEFRRWQLQFPPAVRAENANE
jgi:hypothetical protein